VKVFLDFTSRASGGGVTFLKNFILNLSKVNSHNIYYLFLPTPLSFNLPSNFKTIIVKSFPPYEAWKLLWYTTTINNFIKREKIDLFYGSTGISPLNTDCSTVLTLQNLWPFLPNHSTIFFKIIKRLKKKIIIKCSQRATLLHFASFSAYQYHVKWGLNIDPQKVRIVPFGIDNIFFNKNDLSRVGVLRNNYNLFNVKYLLFVGNIFKHKNIETLLKAFAVFHNNYYYKDIKLVIAGKVMEQDYFLELNKLINDLDIKDNTLFLDEVNYDDLPLLYQSAELFVFPSALETFGFPMLEAMACKVPLLVADTPIAHELCKDAALYFPANDQEIIVHLMLKVIRNSKLKQSLVEKGLDTARNFSWEGMVQKMITIFSEAVSLNNNA
jgi:glycosyltransferase involved in cell wall biosynthesis